ncbi:hypothetical protein [Serratia sp. N21D137]|uniref:hypothetical protein n=1 Tax=Serratia sp. N21D137 TaxID=3397495 RepID=UPI0039E0AE1B
MTRTTEQLRERIRGLEITLQHKNWEAVKADLECMKELLAVREAQSEPETFEWRQHYSEIGKSGPWVKLNDKRTYERLKQKHAGDADYEFREMFTAPPAPAVPDVAAPNGIEILASTYAPRGVTYQWDAAECNAATDSWNACRAAMLNGSGVLWSGFDPAQNCLPAIPDGYKLVPVEPTEAMINAGREIDSSPLNMSPRHRVELIYRAMLAAAPTPTK